MACILHITDHADPSVGLFSQDWEIQCPFEHPDYPSGDAYDDITPDQYEEFKVKMIEIYNEFSIGAVQAIYDFELEKIEQNER